MLRLDEIKKRLFSIDKEMFPSGKMLAAVAVVGKTMWIGNNNHKSHPMMVKKFSNGEENSCCHAEVNALAKVPRQCRHRAELYVIRFQRNGNLSMARPCALCRRFLSYNGIDFRNVYYTNWDGEWDRMKVV